MNSLTTRQFRELFAKLPREVQQQTRVAYQRFLGDPSHPSLRFKKVAGTDSVYSVRITLDYRAVGVLKEDTITWFWLGSHSDYAHLLDEMP